MNLVKNTLVLALHAATVVSRGVMCAVRVYNGNSFGFTDSCRFGTDTLPAVLSSVSCSSASFLVIHQCDYNSITPSSCTNNDDISVTCSE